MKKIGELKKIVFLPTFKLGYCARAVLSSCVECFLSDCKPIYGKYKNRCKTLTLTFDL